MAIASDNGKLAVIMFGQPWQPNVPLPVDTLNQADQQQFLWGFPEVLWGVAEAVAALWCALTGMSGMTGGGDLHELGG